MKSMESCPRDSGEIMVLVMQADVVGEDVEGSVIGVRFWRRERGKRMFFGFRVTVLRFRLEFLQRLGAVVDF